jgi:hypothetical protein
MRSEVVRLCAALLFESPVRAFMLPKLSFV